MGGAITKYVVPGMETLGGAVSQFFAPGNPIGLSMMGSGVGQLAGGTMGPAGQSIGGALGGLGGGLAGGAMGGPAGFVAPGTAGTPSMANIGAALRQNPALSGISPSQVAGVSTQQAGQQQLPATMGQVQPNIGMPQQQQPSQFQQSLAALGPVGQSYMDYVQKMNLLKQQQKTAYAPPHTTPVTQVPQFQSAIGGPANIVIPGQY